MSGIETGLLIAAAVGTAAQTGGQLAAAGNAKDAAEANANMKHMQADELLARQEINEGILREQSDRAQHGFVASFASTGREGAGLGGVLQMKRDLEENILLSRRDAEFKAKMLRMGADIELDLASDSMTAAWITGAGTILTTGARAWNTMRGPSSSPQSLPEVGDGVANGRTGLEPNSPLTPKVTTNAYYS